MTMVWLVAMSGLMAAPWTPPSVTLPAFEFRQGDRVVLVGDGVLEGEARDGYLETLLTASLPELRLIFRNLAWSADTVRGLSRSYFDPPQVGEQRLFEELKRADPTVLIVGYGGAEAFSGPEGLSPFAEGLAALLDRSGVPAERVILLTPLPMLAVPHGPDPSRHNQDRSLYAQAIRDLARERGCRIVDLFQSPTFSGDGFATYDLAGEPLTVNGLHPTRGGYRLLAWEILAGLGIPAERVVLPVSPEKPVRWPRIALPGAPLALRIEQAEPIVPRAVLREDGQRVSVPADSKLPLEIDWPTEDFERLRAEIVRKNRLYFLRYRPHNITYLLGFRQYEQGQNARELDRLDELVREADRRIDELKQPTEHTISLEARL